MRPLTALFGLLRFRFGLGLTGLRLRTRTVLSVGLVLGGIGAAIGYGVMGRVLHDQDDEGASSDPAR